MAMHWRQWQRGRASESFLLILAGLMVVLLGNSRAWAAEPTPSPTGTKPGKEITTEHYSLYVEKLSPEEIGLIAESCHARLASFFGRSSRERMRVEIYETRADFLRTLQAERTKNDENHDETAGCYVPETRKCYLWVQPSAYETRRTLLHELTHQFHFLVAATNAWPRLWLYPEGLADYFSFHTWDGSRLRQAVIPRIHFGEFPAEALAAFRGKHARDLKGLVSGRRKPGYPESWAVMHFLIEHRSNPFRAWMEKLDEMTASQAQTHPLIAWNATYGTMPPEFSEEFETWLESIQAPWRVLSGEWEDTGAELITETTHPQLAIAVLRQPPARLSVRIRPESPETIAGVVFGHSRSNEWHSLTVKGSLLSWSKRSGDDYREQNRWILSSIEKGVGLSLKVSTNRVRIHVEDEMLGDVETSGDVGILVHGGKARFLPEWSGGAPSLPAVSKP